MRSPPARRGFLSLLPGALLLLAAILGSCARSGGEWGILPLEGAGSAAQKTEAVERIAASLTRRGRPTLSGQSLRARREKANGCGETACLADQARDLRLSVIFQGRVTENGVEWEWFHLASGKGARIRTTADEAAAEVLAESVKRTLGN